MFFSMSVVGLLVRKTNLGDLIIEHAMQNLALPSGSKPLKLRD